LTPDLVNKYLHFRLDNEIIGMLVEAKEQLSKLILAESLSLAYIYQVCLDECASRSPAKRTDVL
jgi:hypothetical protein